MTPVPGGPAGSLRRALRAHPLLGDVSLAVALALITVGPAVGLHRPHQPGAVRGGSQLALALSLQVALCAPLALRRRYPNQVYGVIVAVALVQLVLGVRLAGDAALLVALYTVAVSRDRRSAWVAAGVAEVGVVLATLRWAPGGSVIGSLLFLTGMVTAAVSLGISVGTRRAYLAALEDRAQRLERERDQQARIAAAAERARIARELHDVVAHSLAVMVTLADAAGFAADTDPERAAEAVRQVSVTGREALSEMRRLVGVLRDDSDAVERAPQPGLAQLDDLIAAVRAAGPPVDLVRSGEERGLPTGVEIAVYRIVQEALTNTLKHGREVHQVRVEVDCSADAVRVRVRDDGAAAGPAELGSTGHGPVGGHGLVGMRERAALYGGDVQVGPDPGGGWTVAAMLPLPLALAAVAR